MSQIDISKHLDYIHTAVSATITSAQPLIDKVNSHDQALHLNNGLSLLSVRPQLLLSSLHQLVILAAMRLVTGDEPVVTIKGLQPTREHNVQNELAGELLLQQEMMDKVRGLEAKLEYQIKKLAGLAEAEELRGRAVVEDVEEDPLSFRPNPLAIVPSKAQDSVDSEVYRPPRVAAVPYTEGKSQRRDRRAPALLSEFATTMDGAPVLETTSGLSTRPVQTDRHTNSKSAKRAAELKRINEFEEENMTRLVTTKREGKRRREDEQALALGYGVGSGRARGGRQNGLEAELEGVLGHRRSKGLWEGLGAGGQKDTRLEKSRGTVGIPVERRDKKARFEKAVEGASRKKM